MPTINSNLPMPAIGSNEARPAGSDTVETADSGLFASILGLEAVSSSGGDAATAEHGLLPGGGKVLQPGGKVLPEPLAPEQGALIAQVALPVIPDPVPKDIATIEGTNLELAAMGSEPAVTADGIAVAAVGSQTITSPESEVASPVQDLGRPQPFDQDTSMAVGWHPLGTQTIARLPPADSLPARYLSRTDPGHMRQQAGDPGDSLLEGLQFSGSISKVPPGQAVADSVLKSPLSGDAQLDQRFELVEAVKTVKVELAESKVAEQHQLKPPSIDQATAIAASNVLSGRELELPGGLKIAAPATMTTAVGQPGWSGELAGRINLMVNGGSSEANLQLSPPELGRLEIRISTEDDQAKIVFTVQHAHAREAIEQAMPRLREMLEQSGLQLAHSSVADQSRSQQGDSGAAHGSAEPAPGDLEPGSVAVDQALLTVTSDAVVDYYV